MTEAQVETKAETAKAEISPADILLELRKEREANQSALEEMRKITAEQQKLAGVIAMGGGSKAGSVQVTKTKEEELEEITDKMAKDAADRLLNRIKR